MSYKRLICILYYYFNLLSVDNSNFILLILPLHMDALLYYMLIHKHYSYIGLFIIIIIVYLTLLLLLLILLYYVFYSFCFSIIYISTVCCVHVLLVPCLYQPCADGVATNNDNNERFLLKSIDGHIHSTYRDTIIMPIYDNTLARPCIHLVGTHKILV